MNNDSKGISINVPMGVHICDQITIHVRMKSTIVDDEITVS